MSPEMVVPGVTDGENGVEVAGEGTVDGSFVWGQRCLLRGGTGLVCVDVRCCKMCEWE